MGRENGPLLLLGYGLNGVEFSISVSDSSLNRRRLMRIVLV
jgi:hypothetical protein